MARTWLAALVSVLFVVSIGLVTSSAAAQAPVPNWSVGDFWKYSAEVNESGVTVTVSFRYEVLRITSVTVDGTSYEVYESKAQIGVESGGVSYPLNSTEWRRVSDLSEVQRSLEILPFVINDAYSPPADWKWPLEVGTSWSGNTTRISSSNLPGESREDVEYSFEVRSSSTISVPAGTFETFLLRQTMDGESIDVQYAPAVGNFVRIPYSGTIPAGLTIDLVEYRYANASLSSDMLLLLILLLAAVIAVIVAVAVVVRRRRRAPPMGAPMRPGQPPMQPTYQPPPQQPPQQPPQGPGSIPPG